MDGPCIDVMVWCTGIVKRKLRNTGWTGVGFEFDDTGSNNGSVSTTTNIDGGVAMPPSVHANGQGAGGAGRGASKVC